MTDDAEDRAPAALGQVLDVGALDSSRGPSARVRVGVEAGWRRGDTLAIVVPERLPCARCDGGGCDSCGRSGALRAPADPDARTVRVEVPDVPAAGVAIRLVKPFGEAVDVEQLRVELRNDARSDAGVSVLHTAAPRALMATTPQATRSPPVLVVAGGVAALAGIAAALLGQC